MEKFIASFRKVQRVNRVIIALALLAMIAVVFLQTFCRFVIFQSLTWSEELSRYLFVVVIVLDVIRKLVAMYVSAVFVYSGFQLVRIGSYQISPAMSIPMSLLYATILIGFVLNFIALYIDAYQHFTKEEE